MPDLTAATILRALEGHGVHYVVIGAQAAIVHGAPVVTADLDVTPSRDPGNLERLASALRHLDARLRVPGDPEGVRFPVDADMLATAQSWTLVTASGDLDLVFLPAGSQGYEDLRGDATRFALADDLAVWVASLADVIRMKEASNRPKDRVQLPILRETLEVIREREREERLRSRGKECAK